MASRRLEDALKLNREVPSVLAVDLDVVSTTAHQHSLS